MYKDKSEMFEDFNFKLVVINSLLEKETSFREKLEELVRQCEEKEEKDFEEDDSEGEDIREELIEFFENLILTPEDLEQVTELVFDGGEEIYFMLCPYWDGEDDYFDVTSVAGIEKLPNLKEVEYISMAEEGIMEDVEKLGIEVI